MTDPCPTAFDQSLISGYLDHELRQADGQILQVSAGGAVYEWKARWVEALKGEGRSLRDEAKAWVPRTMVLMLQAHEWGGAYSSPFAGMTPYWQVPRIQSLFHTSPVLTSMNWTPISPSIR